MITTTIPAHTVSVANIREHWSKRARRAKDHRSQAYWALRCVGAWSPPCVVTLTRIAPRALDGDNLQASQKAVRDGVADWLGADDRDQRIEWRYRQERGKPREYAVRIEVEAA